MKVTVIGGGYVGLVTAACLADVGNHVVCLDIDEAKIAALKAGRVPIHEPGLDVLIRTNMAAKRLRFTVNTAEAIRYGQAIFIAVGTPPEEDGSADLAHVLAAARSIGRNVDGPAIVVDKSTVPVGTAEKVEAVIAEELAQRGVSHAISVISNPEFLKEGAAIRDFMHPDRVVIGTDDDSPVAIMRALYTPFVRNHDRIIFMGRRSAELTKYAANAMLATRISFMNELANLAELVGADIEEIRLGIGSDTRIGYDFLYAGMGYGGSCFPKDVKALAHTARQAGADLRIINAVDDVNQTQKLSLARKIASRFGEQLEGRTFAVWGLAFKPGTDDMREAPSRALIPWLIERGARIVAFDPVATDTARSVLPEDERLVFATDAMEALKGADALLLLTEWKEFRTPDFETMGDALAMKLIFDGRNVFDPAFVKSLGFEYYGIGRR